MQKFVVKKISRSTNITLGISDSSLSQCEQTQLSADKDLEISSIRMSGYLKKKRNRVGGWSKMYFVLQNSLLMSYGSKEEYEKKLVSFKDVICLIPNNTVLIPSLEPRFTIASNLNTFYTFRCDDNQSCSKWITAILECLSRNLESKAMSEAKNFSSQQNINHHHPKPICNNHSWENLPNNNWIVNHNGRILLELNYLNCNRAKLPIGSKTAQILQKCSDKDDVIHTKHVNFVHDENQNFNFTRNSDHEELRQTNNFRLHNKNVELNHNQTKEQSTINKMFVIKNDRLGNCNNGNEYEYSEIGNGVETQMKQMTLGDESVDYESVPENYQSVDSKRFNNKLVIENSEYAEVDRIQNQDEQIPEYPYATVDLEKKHEGRLKKKNAEKINSTLEDTIYEDIGIGGKMANPKDNDIYEMIDIPLRPSRKSRSMVWKNWSPRIQLFDSLTKRFKDTADDSTLEKINKRKKASLTLSFSKHFNYRSMRSKAAKIYRKKNSAQGSNIDSNNLAADT